VNYLRNVLKKNVYILSGDAKETVERVGKYLGISEGNMIGETDAESKKKLLKSLREEYGTESMMIGDGLNDILSIQEASVGISINAKSELNLLASDIVILNENLWKIVHVFNLMRYARMFIIFNLIWAFAYNLFITPVAGGAFYYFGFTISPLISSAAMSGSSVVVVLFSYFIKFMSYDPSKEEKWQKIEKNYLKFVD